MDLLGSAAHYVVSTSVGIVSFLVSPLVLAYRWKRTPWARRFLDGLQRRFTGRPDWRWLRLWQLMVALAIVTAANIAWQVSTLHCSDDSLAILASGQAALSGHNPFAVSFCMGSSPDHIPYGLAEVALNALGATSGTVLGIWLVWQLLALAVVPLVWAVSAEDRRYVSALAATSVLYLPNIATNIGVENAIVPVSVLFMLFALGVKGHRGPVFEGVAAFLSTAKFPALFPLLGSSAPLRQGRWKQTTIVLGTFSGAILLSYALWGRDAVSIVYLSQVTRVSAHALNLWAVLLQQGWLRPSLTSSAVQGAGLLALVLLVNWRNYSAPVACAVPLVGVMALSQYLTFQFGAWLIPLILLGGWVNRWLYVYGVLLWFDETIALEYLGMNQGIYWPYELCGLLLTVILVYLLIVIVRSEEARLRESATAGAEPSTSPP